MTNKPYTLITEICNAFPVDYCVYDIETTGLGKSDALDIIEIAAVKVRNNNIVDKFESLVKFDKQQKNSAYSINHISDDMLNNAPPIETVLKDFFSFIGNDILIGHNIGNFDNVHIYNKAKRYGLILNNYYIDTLPLSKFLLPNLEHHSVEYFAEYYNIDYSNAHRALADCHIEYEIYRNLKNTNYYRNNISKINNISKTTNKQKINLSQFDWSFFAGKYVAITGDLALINHPLKKDDIFAEVIKVGGYKDENLTINCNYLISADKNSQAKTNEKGEKESAKLKKAKKYKKQGRDIEILSETDFYKIIGYISKGETND